LGGDTETVLRSILGYDDDRIEGLRRGGVFGEAMTT
jgi:hypothetical protein